MLNTSRVNWTSRKKTVRLLLLDIRSYRLTSAVTDSEKNSINMNRKSITRFPISIIWTVYADPKSPKGGSKMQTVKKF